MRQLFAALLAEPTWRQHLQHAAIRFVSDSQAAVADLLGMKGTPPVHAQVCQLYELAAAHDVDVQADWRPRASDVMRYADAMSREPETGDWGISDAALSRVCAAFHIPRVALSLDVFASAHNARAPTFFSRYLVEGAAGVDAFVHDWHVPPPSVPLICPPHMLVAATLTRILDARVSCLLLIPAWYHAWAGLLPLLPCMPPKQGMLIPARDVQWGARAPPPQQRCRALAAGVRAYSVRFA